MRTSFAQNAEDVLLWRCFPGKSDGFYVDVGASSPINDSVTQSFYESGWHGINIEPIPERISELEYSRPRDINICAVAGREEGTSSLVRTSGVGGLSTIAPCDRLHNGSWNIPCKKTTLSSIFSEYSIVHIDFLKIDVEGAEYEVLVGLDLKRWRPTVILIEATLPLSTEQNYSSWHRLLNDSDYHFVWFDGLNRYYVERSNVQKLHDKFLVQPNVFDNYFVYGLGGHPLTNASHPDHWFSKHLAFIVFQMLSEENGVFLRDAFCRDMAPSVLENPISSEVFTSCFKHVLGRSPDEAEIRLGLAAGHKDGRALITSLIDSDEFRNLRTRMAIRPS